MKLMIQEMNVDKTAALVMRFPSHDTNKELLRCVI